MKFLLTSAGLTNQSIARAVLELTGLDSKETKLAFVPTAVNVENGDKSWLIDDLLHFKEQGYKSIDIVDIAALPQKIWQPRLEAANVICFGGGNEQYLAYVVRKSGFKELLPVLLKNRVYIGISAGSMLVGHFLPPELLRLIFPDNGLDEKPESSLGLVACYFVPHLNSPHFPQVRKEVLQSMRNKLSLPLYALDDQSALKIQGGRIEVISEGQYLKI